MKIKENKYFLSKCLEYDSKKIISIEKQKAGRLLGILGNRAPLSKSLLVGYILDVKLELNVGYIKT